MSYQKSFDEPSPLGPLAQIIHAAVDLGIARAAVKETVSWIRTRARPWIDSGQDSAAEDPLTLLQIGELHVALHSAEEILRLAGQAVDNVLADPNSDTLAIASIAVAEPLPRSPTGISTGTGATLGLTRCTTRFDGNILRSETSF
jgi:alkylation response protein AidB-like acyl-CoA dehydrogenase